MHMHAHQSIPFEPSAMHAAIQPGHRAVLTSSSFRPRTLVAPLEQLDDRGSDSNDLWTRTEAAGHQFLDGNGTIFEHIVERTRI